jgi:hypothetical protein
LTFRGGIEPIERHVLFVHGVRFSSKAYWRSAGERNESWPLWLIDDIPRLGVWEVEYPAAPTLWRGHSMSLVDRASNITPLLLEELRLKHGELAFVAHSFGGLVLQQVLRVLGDRAPSERAAAHFVERVRRISFLGTPHRGTEVPSWLELLSHLLRPSPAISGARRNDPNLRDLNRWCRRFVSDYGVATQTVQETQKTFFSIVVAPDSGDPGLLSDPIPVDSDHLGLASPASRESEVYIHIRAFLATPLASPQRRRFVDEQSLLNHPPGIAGNTALTETLASAVERNVVQEPERIAIELVDAEADRQLSLLRRRRFFRGTSPFDEAKALSVDLVQGRLVLASPLTKCRTLAWCARLLLGDADRSRALEILNAARRLPPTEDLAVADAFELTYGGSVDDALERLHQHNSTMARSAAFMIVKIARGPNEAITWFRESGLTLADIDSEGKFFVIGTQLDTNAFDEALRMSSELRDADFVASPALLFLSASAHLASVLPTDLRSWAITQPPALIASIPLAEDTLSLQRRRMAHDLYGRAAVEAATLQCLEASRDFADRQMAIALRESDLRAAAIAELQEDMREPAHSLRRVPLALRAGLDLDLREVESAIARNIALSGGGTVDASLAKFAIAQTLAPAEVSPYLEANRKTILRHLRSYSVAALELTSLVESGQLEMARTRLNELSGEDVDQDERDRLSRIVLEAGQSDPVAYREQQFSSTKALPELLALVDGLRQHKRWPRLVSYARILFERTRDFSSCHNYALALFKSGEFLGVVEHLASVRELVARSPELRALLAWSLYALGRLRESQEELLYCAPLATLPKIGTSWSTSRLSQAIGAVSQASLSRNGSVKMIDRPKNCCERDNWRNESTLFA